MGKKRFQISWKNNHSGNQQGKNLILARGWLLRLRPDEIELNLTRLAGVQLEFWPMPSFRDKAHDGVLWTIQYLNISNNNGICQKLAVEQLQTRANGTVRQGRRHGPPITTLIAPGWVTFFQPARQSSVLGHLSRVSSSLVITLGCFFDQLITVECLMGGIVCLCVSNSK